MNKDPAWALPPSEPTAVAAPGGRGKLRRTKMNRFPTTKTFKCFNKSRSNARKHIHWPRGRKVATWLLVSAAPLPLRGDFHPAYMPFSSKLVPGNKSYSKKIFWLARVERKGVRNGGHAKWFGTNLARKFREGRGYFACDLLTRRRSMGISLMLWQE